MGYYTSYELHEQNGKIDIEGIVKKLDPDKFEDLIYAIANGDSLNYTSNILDEVAAFSKMFPNEVFELYAKTEDDEYYLRYYKNGLYHEVPGNIVYGEYDESKLSSL